MAKAPVENGSANVASVSGSQFAPVEVGSSGPGSDSRAIMLKVKMADGSEKEISRADYIRARAQERPQPSRGQIRKEVSALQGKEVSYQTIFGATKDLYEKKATKKGETAPSTGSGAVAE